MSLRSNVIANLVGQFVVVIIGLAVFPVAIPKLGEQRFGLLSLIWVFQGQMALLDLGFGRTTTAYVSKCLAAYENDRARSILWSSTLITFVIGVALSIPAYTLASSLVWQLLAVPIELRDEATKTFQILALMTPLIVTESSLRGGLEGSQRFWAANLSRNTSRIGLAVITLIAAYRGGDLVHIMIAMASLQFAIIVILVWQCIHSFGWPRDFLHPKLEEIQEMFGYSIWISVSNLIGPILMSLERIALGSLKTLTDVTHFSTAYVLVSRIFIVPAILMPALFPVLSSLQLKDRTQLENIFSKSIKLITVITGLLLIFISWNASWLLEMWTTRSLAESSMWLAQILSIGIFINCLARLPYDLLQAQGRVRSTGILHLIELPISIAITSWAVEHLGSPGAAAIHSLRIITEAVALFTLVGLLSPELRSVIKNNINLIATVCVALGIPIAFPDLNSVDLIWKLVASLLASLAVFILFTTSAERSEVIKFTKFSKYPT